MRAHRTQSNDDLRTSVTGSEVGDVQQQHVTTSSDSHSSSYCWVSEAWSSKKRLRVLFVSDGFDDEGVARVRSGGGMYLNAVVSGYLRAWYAMVLATVDT